MHGRGENTEVLEGEADRWVTQPARSSPYHFAQESKKCFLCNGKTVLTAQ